MATGIVALETNLQAASQQGPLRAGLLLPAEALGWGMGPTPLPTEEWASGLTVGPMARLKTYQFPWPQLLLPSPLTHGHTCGDTDTCTHTNTITFCSTWHWDRQQVLLPLRVPSWEEIGQLQ